METLYGILIPFLGTTLGAACVFFMKKAMNDQVRRALTGFAAGVMVAASIWSLLIPAIDQCAPMGKWAFLPSFLGFWVGILFLLLLDHIIPHLHQKSVESEGPRSSLGRSVMMLLAVTLHNIPEGMAVGVVYAGFRADSASITAAGALGIAIQNFPEGAIVSMPLRAEGVSKGKAFWGGMLSGVVDRRGDHAAAGGSRPSRTAVFAGVCSRCDDLRCGGRADSGDVSGRKGTFQHRHGVLCAGLHDHDGAGSGARIRFDYILTQGDSKPLRRAVQKSS